ncbi:hypothetical protein [Janthinobacterium sp.]|uniref:hypothetical protein n=1 Tax=Janthinobacterium sp. TaxID=1871054 RepID=UPI002898E305|nr:hypothetical protein [Janthinobacterium sp.]
MRANNSAESIKLLHILADDQLQTGPTAMLRLVMFTEKVAFPSITRIDCHDEICSQ